MRNGGAKRRRLSGSFALPDTVEAALDLPICAIWAMVCSFVAGHLFLWREARLMIYGAGLLYRGALHEPVGSPYLRGPRGCTVNPDFRNWRRAHVETGRRRSAFSFSKRAQGVFRDVPEFRARTSAATKLIPCKNYLLTRFC